VLIVNGTLVPTRDHSIAEYPPDRRGRRAPARQPQRLHGVGGEELPDWKQEHNRSHRQVRARVEHVIARLHNLALAG